MEEKPLKEEIKESPKSHQIAYNAIYDEGFRDGQKDLEAQEALAKAHCDMPTELEEDIHILKENLIGCKKAVLANMALIDEREKELTEANHNLKAWKNRSKEFEKDYYEKSDELADTKGELDHQKRLTESMRKLAREESKDLSEWIHKTAILENKLTDLQAKHKAEIQSWKDTTNSLREAWDKTKEELAEERAKTEEVANDFVREGN